MIKAIKYSIISILLLTVGIANAAIVSTNGKITSALSYAEYGTGDVVFQLNTTLAGCENGFWLRPTDAGFKTNISFLLAAQLSGRNVYLQAHNDLIWNGSAAKTCKLYVIQIV